MRYARSTTEDVPREHIERFTWSFTLDNGHGRNKLSLVGFVFVLWKFRKMYLFMQLFLLEVLCYSLTPDNMKGILLPLNQHSPVVAQRVLMAREADVRMSVSTH